MLRCGDRTCPDCRKRDYYRLFFGYRDVFRDKSRLRFISLTLKNTNDLSRWSVDFLRGCFRKLCRSSSVSSKIKGGMYGIEITNKGKGWHVHMHVICEGGYIPQQELSREWCRITGGSYVVDIRIINSGEDALRYMLKYLLKKPCVDGKDDVYNAYMVGVRMFSFFGSWYPVRLVRGYMYVCPKCGCAEWISEYELWRLSSDAREVSCVVGLATNKDPPNKPADQWVELPL